MESRVAAARVKVGADVLPWWPARGVYLLLETHATPLAELVEVEGVAGIWSMAALDVGPKLASARAGQQLSYCFLDGDPVATAARLRPVLEMRWSATGIDPLFAAPFHPVVPHEWSRYVP